MADLSNTYIYIKGAREHNLKNIELRLPRGKLVVITGVSGSGKSSLAFDTLYAEGYRKYMESLSVRARQLLDQVKRPDVDFIQGLSPVIAIEQHEAGGSNPRSTVATATEVADYARLLWAVCGESHCPKDGAVIERRTLDDCIERIFKEPSGSRLMILAPYLKEKVSLAREEVQSLRQRGFQRVRINGKECRLDEPGFTLPHAQEIVLDIVVDRIVLAPDQRSRLADSLELAFKEGKDRAIILVQSTRDGTWHEFGVSRDFACVLCGSVYEPLTPRHFSSNHPQGACTRCRGLGEEMAFNEALIVADPEASIRSGAIKPWRLGSKAMIIKRNAILKQLAEQLPFDPTIPWRSLPKAVQQVIMHGAGERLFAFKLKSGNSKPEKLPFKGVLADLQESFETTSSDGLKAKLMAYQVFSPCTACAGTRFNERVRSVFVGGISIDRFLGQSIRASSVFVQKLARQAKRERWMHADEPLEGLMQRLSFLEKVGVGYLTLDRSYATLSGGEVQRVRLATQLGMGLVGVIYVLDEPSIGLHARDHQKLLDCIFELRDRGNAVIVVEHDRQTIAMADHLVELGPSAGRLGGELMFEGTPQEILTAKRSITGKYLSGALKLERDALRLKPRGDVLAIRGACEHNLKQVDVSFPVGLVTCVCGVSGSGKSTLVNGILGKAAAFRLNRAKEVPGKHAGIDGLEHFTTVVRVDQSPIGKSPRSNPATYIKLFDLLRTLFSQCSLARVRGYKPNRFSFNVRGGRCERCEGDGAIKLDMQFLSDVYVECPSCEGKRYNRETLEVRFKGLTIADVLDLTVDEAMQLFRHQPKIATKLQTLIDVGLGYLKLGQPANTLSGGEAQRIKLALELSKRSQGGTLYILDEPTTGLHWEDIQKLMDLLFKLRDAGNTLIVIEHQEDVLNLADWLIELGPEGGSSGGYLLYAGPPEGIVHCKDSPTGQCMREHAKEG